MQHWNKGQNQETGAMAGKQEAFGQIIVLEIAKRTGGFFVRIRKK
jgi:hypothetical protein